MTKYAWAAEVQSRESEGVWEPVETDVRTLAAVKKAVEAQFPEESFEWSKWTASEHRAVTENYLFALTRSVVDE